MRPVPIVIERRPPAHAPPRAALAPRFRLLMEVELERTFDWGLHRHDCYEAIVVRAGVYRCRLNGERIELGPGWALMVAPGDEHQDLLDGPLRYRALWFDFDAGVSLFARTVAPRAQALRLGAQAHAALRQLGEVAEDPSPAGGGLRDALLAQVLWLAVRALPPEALARPFRGASDDQLFAARLHGLFERHPRGRLRVGAMARALGLTEATLTHRCRAALGVAPASALRHRRLDQARGLLAHSGLSVRAVAEQCGFANQFHFSRAFKRRHGVAPSALR